MFACSSLSFGPKNISSFKKATSEIQDGGIIQNGAQNLKKLILLPNSQETASKYSS
jgi:hypothetical protein